MKTDHEKFMALALKEAAAARQKGEIPIGAVIVSEQKSILASTHNQVIALSDPTAHAEVLALREAARRIGNYRLLNTTIYVTVEPCIMCMGAIIHARVQAVIFGAPDPKWGAAGSVYDFASDNRLNHRPAITGGICEAACKNLMQDFFRDRR